MNEKRNVRVCPAERAGILDNSLRKIFQHPRKILKPFILDGMTVLDLGCGPGFFTFEIAKMLSNTGKVIAADLQQGMLDKVFNKIKNTGLEHKVELHKCDHNRIGIKEPVDIVFAFWMMHEVPDQDGYFDELLSIIKPDGLLYIVEPKFHVSKRIFDLMIEKLKDLEFEIVDFPKVFFSRTVLMTIKK
ncbi:MAG: class I SAM-dependent methyltransferase [Bacteroidota bacterium]